MAWPLGAWTVGGLQVGTSSRAVRQISSPVSMSNAAKKLSPWTSHCTNTRPSWITGELAKPQSGIFVSVSEAALRDHTTVPSPASSTFRIPVAPNVYTRPPLRVGVPRGPAPAFDSQNRAASRCLHTSSPVVTL